MIGRPSLFLPVFLAVFAVNAGAVAQSVGPDEAINSPHGAIAPQLALTASQKSAIYNAVLQQKARAPGPALPAGVPLTIGAPVSPAVQLPELPNPASAGKANDIEPRTDVLKYAMVEDDVVLVDPIGMRVVEIIHGGAE